MEFIRVLFRSKLGRRLGPRSNRWFPHPKPGRISHCGFAMFAMALCLSGYWPRPGWALTGTGDLATEQMSVRELMRLDTVLALRLAKDRLREHQKTRSVGAVPQVAAQSGDPRLLAIYGVGRKLLARVRYGERTFMYMHGRTLPVGVKNAQGNPVFRLRGISSSCVELERAGTSRTLCLHPSLWSGD